MGEKYTIEIKRLKGGEIESRIYRIAVGEPNNTRCEINPDTLSTPYKAFYKKIVVEAETLIKKANLEKVIKTTFETI